ncbi:hypothetical protein BDQ12DRAFT_684185 [Crucibulum laeve]|uniref:Calpain catalytic domain-containing protein n=1 Tax=Crucibulum laeve TaxID=68775 RepID=A0A5C3M1K8_9AGAR|nr:hypothetical protein BDQ12DRAFT_684185 [Crucibulum laeve]
MATSTSTSNQTTTAIKHGYQNGSHILTFVQTQPGLLVTKELDKAIQECRNKVKRIAKECHAKNRKFRDIEFDLEDDKQRCLYGIFKDKTYTPSDVQRVTQIFNSPHFFVNEAANSNDIVQGNLGDCWFLSALATVSTAQGLVEKFCVERDEKVGIYGFIFFRDNAWVNIIVDDLLYTRVPKYEELTETEKEIYHSDKDMYNKCARKGGKTLYFAGSGNGETWVPLVEKAYAKLHGNYEHLNGGHSCEAIEDLTGGVSTFVKTKDILDPERFWDEELLRANKDRLFGCSFTELSDSRSGNNSGKVQGLYSGHAYSVLRAVECSKGKRFIVLRNPWGNTGWNGRWSDGSKEWTAEWLTVLPELKHTFGDDGQFVMEYSDWLEIWENVGRTVLFDENWAMSSQWICVPARPLPSAWSYGDVSFSFTLPGPSATVIVLSQIDNRYFKDIAGRSFWSLDFVLVKAGEEEPLAQSTHSRLYSRSVNLEIDLTAGDYIVYVRVDHYLGTKETRDIEDWQLRQFSRTLSEKAKGQSITSNFDTETKGKYLPTQLESLIKTDADAYRTQKAEQQVLSPEFRLLGLDTPQEVADKDDFDADGTITTTTTTTTVVVKKVRKNSETAHLSKEDHRQPGGTSETQNIPRKYPNCTCCDKKGNANCMHMTLPGTYNFPSSWPGSFNVDQPTTPSKPANLNNELLLKDDNSVYVGLRVYSRKDVPARVVGSLKSSLLHAEPSPMSPTLLPQSLEKIPDTM